MKPIRTIIVLFCLLLTQAIVVAEDEINPLFRISIDDKTGYINQSGEIVIEPQLDFGSLFGFQLTNNIHRHMS